MSKPLVLSQLLVLVRLELKLFFRDRRALMLVFLVPIGIASFVGALTGGAGDGDRANKAGLQLLITDLDQSPMSRSVVRSFATDLTFRVTETNETRARELVLGGKRPVALILPAGFGAQAVPGLFDTNRKPVVTIYFDPSRSMERQLVEGLLVPKVLQSVAQNAFTIDSARNLIREGLTNLDQDTKLSAGDRQRFHELMSRTDELLAARTRSTGSLFQSTPGAPGANSFSLPLPFKTEATPLTRGTAAYNGYAHAFAGMGVQFVLMAMIDLAVTLLRERESGVFRRLRSTPLSRATVLAAKALAWATISLISLLGCFAFAMVVFKVRIEGSWLGFLGMMLATSLMASTLGLALAAVGRTPAGTRGFSIALILFLVMIGGAWMPTFIFPQWLQQVSVFAPTRWALDGIDAMTWRGLGLEASLWPMTITLLFAGVFAITAWVKFKWEA